MNSSLKINFFYWVLNYASTLSLKRIIIKLYVNSMTTGRGKNWNNKVWYDMAAKENIEEKISKENEVVRVHAMRACRYSSVSEENEVKENRN